MATSTAQAISRSEIKRYVIIDPAFKKEAKARDLALAAAGLLYWIDQAKATFSASTGARYLESLYWDPSNPDRISMGVIEGTLSSVLEQGQGEKDLRSIFSRSKIKQNKKGEFYRIIPIDDSSSNRSQTRYIPYESYRMPLSISQNDILYYINHMDPEVASRKYFKWDE